MKKYQQIWLVFALCTIGCIAFALSGYTWVGWKGASCLPHCFCEHLHAGTVKQPMNTWSNLGFVVVGILVAWRSRNNRNSNPSNKNPMTETEFYPLLFAVVSASLGFTSLFYHASMTFVGQWFDVMSMYLVVGFMLVYNVSRLRPMSPLTFLLTYLAMSIICGWIQYDFPAFRRWLFGILVLSSLFFEIYSVRKKKSGRDTKQLLYALITSVFACTVWLLDSFRVKGFCFPKSYFQGHAIWHLLCAVTVYFIYKYYESESGNSDESILDHGKVQ